MKLIIDEPICGLITEYTFGVVVKENDEQHTIGVRVKRMFENFVNKHIVSIPDDGCDGYVEYDDDDLRFLDDKKNEIITQITNDIENKIIRLPGSVDFDPKDKNYFEFFYGVG